MSPLSQSPGHELNSLFPSIKTALHHSNLLVFWRLMWNYFPEALMPYVKYTPTKEHRHIRHTTRVFHEVASQVLDELTGDVSEKEGKKDVMSILGEPVYRLFRHRLWAVV